MSHAEDLIEVRVTSVTNEAQGIGAWEFRRPDGGSLPAFSAGAHIDLHLPNDLVRSYSLCNAQTDTDRYVVAINLDPNSRGGSKFVHEQLRVGDLIRISPARNHFPLVEDDGPVVLIAGGIGITPIWSMIQRLEQLGRPWELFYSTRLRQMCAFHAPLKQLEHQSPGRVHFNFDQEPGGGITDLRALLAGVPKQAHLYCCGPAAMLKAFESAAADAGHACAQVHVEHFSATEAPATERGYTVVLQQSGLSFEVAPGQTILETLLLNDVDVPYSCMEGVCGRCETAVLEGVPDHRDSILSDEEKASGRTMMICCSGSKGERLVLDK